MRDCLRILAALLLLLLVSCAEDDGYVVSEAAERLNAASVYDTTLSQKDYLSKDVKYGEIVDARDGRVYKTVEIGTQVWMAENLNYADSAKTKNLKGNSWCYQNKKENCEKAGRLYTWTAAMDIDPKFQRVTFGTDSEEYENYNHRQGICPEGFHLPRLGEMQTLWQYVDSLGLDAEGMKSVDGWEFGGGGTNVVGFSLLPAGTRDTMGLFSEGGYASRLWLEGVSDGYGIFMQMYSFSRITHVYTNSGTVEVDDVLANPRDANSIRCLANADSIRIVPAYVNESYNVPLESVVKDSIVDKRDGRVYRTVRIGEQNWMAENLDYADSAANPYIPKLSHCYENKGENCGMYGRIYQYSLAMSGELCPEGWRLPNRTDFSTLLSSITPSSYSYGSGSGSFGYRLKPGDVWQDNGTDAYGFSALPGGRMDSVGHFSGLGENTYFMINSAGYSVKFVFAVYKDSIYSAHQIQLDWGLPAAGYVRCIEMSEGEEIDVWEPYKSDSSAMVDGYLVDYRDNQKYRVMNIGGATWMAENLNLEYPASDYERSFCYEKLPSNCTRYGRLYTLAGAMDAVGKFSNVVGAGCGGSGECVTYDNMRGSCPAGWHVPTIDEFRDMLAATGDTLNAAKYLRPYEVWNDDISEDKFGFCAMPGGYKTVYDYKMENYGAFFWTSSIVSDSSHYVGFLKGEEGPFSGVAPQNIAYSLRCVKNEPLDDSEVTKRTGTVAKPDTVAEEGFGIIVDKRDGRTYRTSVIGDQEWMAENLNYHYGTSSFMCFRDDVYNCAAYGRVYTWALAVDSLGLFSESAKGCGYGVACEMDGEVRGACPEGWRLPTIKDVDELLDSLGGGSKAAMNLRTVYDWENFVSGSFWTVEEYEPYSSASHQNAMLFSVNDLEIVHNSYSDKSNGYFVRCMRDVESD